MAGDIDYVRYLSMQKVKERKILEQSSDAICSLLKVKKIITVANFVPYLGRCQTDLFVFKNTLRGVVVELLRVLKFSAEGPRIVLLLSTQQ